MLQEVMDKLEDLKKAALQNAFEQCERVDAHIRDLETTKAWINDTALTFVALIDHVMFSPPPATAPAAAPSTDTAGNAAQH